MTKSTTMKLLAGVGVAASVAVIGGLIYWGVRVAAGEQAAEEAVDAVKAAAE